MAINLKSLQHNNAKPPRIIIHSAPGLGKTTFGASAPDPIFIQTEDGLGNLDVQAFPLARSFSDVIDALSTLYMEQHEFKTCVIDSLDWLEPLLWDQVCKNNNIESIEKMPYGRGYTEALTHWRRFFEGVTALRDARGMTIIMTAHSEQHRVEDPLLPAYDTHDLKLHKRAGAMAEEFADVILYATVQTHTVTEDMGFNVKRTRAVTTGARIMHSIGQPAFLAKNRYSLPSPLPLAWEAFAEALYGPPAPALVQAAAS